MSDKTGKNILALMGALDGHIAGMIEILKDLVSLGHNVTCFVLEKFENRVKNIGAKLKIIPTPHIILPPNAPKIAMNSFTLAHCYDIIIEDGIKTKEKYDYLIADSFFDYNVINQYYKIENIISTFIFPISIEKKFLYETEEGRKKAFIRINKKYNINIRDFIRMHYFPDAKYKFMLTSKYFHPDSPVINDDSFYFLGPSIEEKRQEISIDFKKDENKKLIYISLGTVFNENIDFYKKCIKTFENSKEFQIIMNIGQKCEVKDLGELPGNIAAFNFVPQIKILKETDIFITHGGINSVNEAIFEKLPLIVIPQNLDQIDNAKQIEKIKAGISLDINNITPEILKKAINNFIENKETLKKGVEKIRQSFIKSRKERKKIYEKIFG